MLAKLKRLDHYQRDTLAKSDSLSKANLQEKLIEIQSGLSREPEKAEVADFFNDFQKILDKNQAGFDFVRETLSQLPEFMEITDLKSLARNETPELPSPDPMVQELRKQIDLLLSLSAEIATKTFIEAPWTSEVMNNLKHILEQYVFQTGANEQCVQLFPETMAEAAIVFVMATNRAFTKQLKRS